MGISNPEKWDLTTGIYTNPEVIKAALKLAKQKPMVNSITGEEARIESIMPMVKDYGTSVVALTIDETGMPRTGQDRLRIARKIIEMVAAYDVPMDDVYNHGSDETKLQNCLYQ
jgi:5-methyltetrahydrofolate--homocysteine methyltransferase